MSSWTVGEPTQLPLTEALRSVRVRLVAGTVDVVTTDGEPCVEVAEIRGEPLSVRLLDGALTVDYPDEGVGSLLGWLRGRRPRYARVSVAVPAAVSAEVSVVSADVVVAGPAGEVAVRTVSGEVVLDELPGPVRVKTVSGSLQCRGLSGEASFRSVSGALALVDGAPRRISAQTVSGDVLLDVASLTTEELDLHTVSGALTLRFPPAVDLDIDVRTSSGRVSSELGSPGSNAGGPGRFQARLGAGTARLQARTVSGEVTILAREPG